MTARPICFRSFFQGGFECSTHRRGDGRRLDLIDATKHDVHARSDYAALNKLGIKTVRDGIRWHLIEKRPWHYDFSSVLPMLRAAREIGTQVIWDLCHYGWPDDIDIFSAEFVARFASLARAFGVVLRDETEGQVLISPVNEPSFVAWAGGDVGYINPLGRGRGLDLKCQLVRAVVAAAEAIRQVLPGVRIVHCEPAIHITADVLRPQDREVAALYSEFQFQSLDMIAGNTMPELGGSPALIDIIGLNYYGNNQWVHNGPTVRRPVPGEAREGEQLYRPFRELLKEFHERYDRPVFVSETGSESGERAPWLEYIAAEVYQAQKLGVPVQGICLYPVLDYPGWDNDRHCPCGLFGYADASGQRALYQPLADAVQRWQPRFLNTDSREFAQCGT